MSETDLSNSEGESSSSALLEPASPQSISYLEGWIGYDALKYLESTDHPILCGVGMQEGEKNPSIFFIRDSDRIMSLQIIGENPYKQRWPFTGQTVITVEYQFEEDFIKHGDFGFGTGVTRKSLSGNTLKFLRFCFEILKRIRNIPVVLQASDDKRYRIYDKMLNRIGNPENIYLTKDIIY